MNRVLKYAWYQLIVILVAIAFAGISIWVIATYWRGREFSALIPLGPLALVHFYKVFFPLKKGEIAFDERDEVIMKRATRISFTTLLYIFALGCLIPIVVIGNGSIHVMYLGGLLFLAVIVFRLIWAIAVIIQYGRTSNENQIDNAIEGEIA